MAYRSLLAIFSVVLLLTVFSGTRGQSCEPWGGSPSFCTQFPAWEEPNTLVYSPPGTVYAETVNKANYVVNSVGVLMENDTSIDGRCNLYFLKMICLTFFRPCVVVTTPNQTEQTVLMPVQPCLTQCEDYVSQCKTNTESRGFQIGMGLYLPPNSTYPMTCSEMEVDSSAFWQEKSYNLTIPQYPNEQFSQQCNFLNSSKVVIECEAPLSNSDDTTCSFTCPLPSYSESQFDRAKVMQLVLGWLSWAGSLVLILSYLLHPLLRKFPSNLILMTALAAHFSSVGIILPTFAGYENTWCGLDTVYLRPTIEGADAEGRLDVDFDIEELSVQSGLCTFQGWLLQSGFLSSTMWWGIVSFNMFFSVFFGKKLPEDKNWRIGVQVSLHLLGWGVPALLMLIPAAAGKIVFAPGAFFSMDGGGWMLAFWVVPVGIILFVELKKAAATYIRVIVFINIFLCLYTFIFAYTIRVTSDKEDIEEGYAEYFSCLLFSETAPYCELSESVHNYSLAMLNSFGYSTLGLLLFLNFCISVPIGRCWWAFFVNLSRGEFKNAVSSDWKNSTTKTPKKSKGNLEHMTVTVTMDESSE
ncbi:hypothetical protein QOT17_018672 [Balamuthia mandrillaris]